MLRITALLVAIVTANKNVDLSTCSTQTSEINGPIGEQSNKSLTSHSGQLKMISDQQRAFYHINELVVCPASDG